MDITDELLDRYGDMPKPVDALLNISLLRSCGAKSNIGKIVKRGSSILFYPEKMDLMVWSKLASDRKGSVLISLEIRPYITLKAKANEDLFEKAISMLNDYQSIKRSCEPTNN
jgi:transcription-repair coupling factor (superfamily II helicase)